MVPFIILFQCDQGDPYFFNTHMLHKGLLVSKSLLSSGSLSRTLSYLNLTRRLVHRRSGTSTPDVGDDHHPPGAKAAKASSNRPCLRNRS